MMFYNSCHAHLTGCIITNSTVSGFEVRLAPADERSYAEEALHEPSPHQPAAIKPYRL